MPVNEKRLGDLFASLVRIDSVSKKEGRLAGALEEMLRSLGGAVVTDGAGAAAGSDTGNLVARFPGNMPDLGNPVPPLLLSAHMDTVEPGEGIEPVFSGGVFTSGGETILGADDKSALAIIVEVLRCLEEDGIVHGPLELVFTICEEVGLLGAKSLDYGLISAPYGYCLDTGGINGMVTEAPALNRLRFTVTGRAAHAGAEPEKGVNAIVIAGEALAGLATGRIDDETTSNIGTIEGGRAMNIVPEAVTVTGEVRSHDMAKLARETDRIAGRFDQAVASYRVAHPSEDGLPKLDGVVEREFSAMRIPHDHPVVHLAEKAAAALGRDMKTRPSGGGSDGNIFFEHGIVTGILGTGMKDVHSVRESVALGDMVQAAELLLEIIRVHAGGD